MLYQWGTLSSVSFPGVSAPSEIELWSEAAVTDYGVWAPPGGVFQGCQVQARGTPGFEAVTSFNIRTRMVLMGISRDQPEICCLQGEVRFSLCSS